MGTRKCAALVAALLFLEISSPVESCSCLPPNLQTSVCEENAVLKVTFLEPSQKTGDSQMMGYEVQVKEVLTGPKPLKDLKFIDSMSGTSCEYYHNSEEYNMDYLIAATSNKGEVTVNSCSFIVPWKMMSDQQIKGARGAYREGCSCKIQFCYSPPCSSSEPKTCMVENYKGGDGENQKTNQVCVPKTSTSTECVWKTIE